MTDTKNKKQWRLFTDCLKEYRGCLIAAAFFVLLGTACNYLAPLVTGFTLDYIIAGNNASVPEWLLQCLDTLGGRVFLTSRLYLCAFAFFMFTAGNGACNYLRRKFVAKAAEGMAKNMRNRLYRHLNAVPYDYHKHVSTGDLVQRCTSDVETARKFLSQQLMEVVRTLFMFISALVIMLSLHKTMALISLCVLPPLTVFSFVYFRRVQKVFAEADEAEGRLSTALQENLTGVRVVRAFGQQRSEMNKFTKLNADCRDANLRLNRLLALYWSFSDAVGYSQIGITLAAGIVFCYKGTFTLGLLTMFATYTAMLTWPLRQMGRILADMGKCSVSLGRLKEILDAPAETEPGRSLTPDMHGEIAFDHVCFGYDAPDDVLKNISFTVKPGQTVGVLGSTGSGKSSLAHLLQRLYTCSSGRILINGTDINDIRADYLRKNIGIVLQEPFLYARSVRDNIRITCPEADDSLVREAASQAAVDEVIMNFKNGYDTIVGERGVTLSGGQQQRVAIARVLMQKPTILIFDDSMSAVDTETDAKIRNMLLKQRGSGIMFLISHRITTLSKADIILVLDHGELIETGTHDELLQKDGFYKRVAMIQHACREEENK